MERLYKIYLALQLPPEVQFFRALIEACKASGSFDTAVKYLKDLKERHLRLDVTTSAVAMLNVAVKSDDPKISKTIFALVSLSKRETGVSLILLHFFFSRRICCL